MPHFAPFYERILEEIRSLPLDDAPKLASFAEMAKRTIPGSPDDPSAIEAILREWSEKLFTAGFSEDIFGLRAFLEELQTRVVRESSSST